eukprot:Selendium_serpulae@DN4405_c0_g1_i1.p1
MNFEFPDPLIGKAKELEREFRFMRDNWAMEDHLLLDRLKWIIPFALRSGMPSYFEEKIFRNPMAYIPTNRGGFGIPNLFQDFLEKRKETTDQHSKAVFLCKSDPNFIRAGRDESRWCRGILFTQKLYDLSQLNLAEPMSYEDIWASTQESLDHGSTTMSSARRVTRKVYKDFINLLEPNPLIGTKEDVFSEIYSGRYIHRPTRRRRRARHVLSMLRNDAIQNAGAISVMGEPDWNVRHGDWIDRSDLLARLRVSALAPSVSVGIEYLTGRASRYEFDDQRAGHVTEEPPIEDDHNVIDF